MTRYFVLILWFYDVICPVCACRTCVLVLFCSHLFLVRFHLVLSHLMMEGLVTSETGCFLTHFTRLHLFLTFFICYYFRSTFRWNFFRKFYLYFRLLLCLTKFEISKLYFDSLLPCNLYLLRAPYPYNSKINNSTIVWSGGAEISRFSPNIFLSIIQLLFNRFNWLII